MIKKLIVLTLGMSLLAAIGCGQKSKTEIKKTLVGRNAKTGNREKVQDKDLNKVIMSNAQCLPLAKLAETMAKAKKPYTMYTRSRALISAPVEVTEDRKLVNDLVLNIGVAKTAYPTELNKTSPFADFFNVSADSNCEQVKFLGGQAPVTFYVKLAPGETRVRENGKMITKRQDGQPGKLKLESRDGKVTVEYSTLDGTNDLQIEITEPVQGTACDGTAKTLELNTKYVVNLIGDESKFSIGNSFATRLEASLTTGPDAIKTDKRKVVGGGVKVTLDELHALNDEIGAKHFKSCSK